METFPRIEKEYLIRKKIKEGYVLLALSILIVLGVGGILWIYGIKP